MCIFGYKHRTVHEIAIVIIDADGKYKWKWTSEHEHDMDNILLLLLPLLLNIKVKRECFLCYNFIVKIHVVRTHILSLSLSVCLLSNTIFHNFHDEKKNLATATATACSRNQCELQKQMGTGETSQTN